MSDVDLFGAAVEQPKPKAAKAARREVAVTRVQCRNCSAMSEEECADNDCGEWAPETVEVDTDSMPWKERIRVQWEAKFGPTPDGFEWPDNGYRSSPESDDGYFADGDEDTGKVTIRCESCEGVKDFEGPGFRVLTEPAPDASEWMRERFEELTASGAAVEDERDPRYEVYGCLCRGAWWTVLPFRQFVHEFRPDAVEEIFERNGREYGRLKLTDDEQERGRREDVERVEGRETWQYVSSPAGRRVLEIEAVKRKRAAGNLRAANEYTRSLIDALRTRNPRKGSTQGEYDEYQAGLAHKAQLHTLLVERDYLSVKECPLEFIELLRQFRKETQSIGDDAYGPDDDEGARLRGLRGFTYFVEHPTIEAQWVEKLCASARYHGDLPDDSNYFDGDDTYALLEDAEEAIAQDLFESGAFDPIEPLTD